jgi:ALIX V-shaped domain binding to HIV
MWCGTGGSLICAGWFCGFQVCVFPFLSVWLIWRHAICLSVCLTARSEDVKAAHDSSRHGRPSSGARRHASVCLFISVQEEKQRDNILPKLMSRSDSYDALFAEELKKYDGLKEEVAANVDKQRQALEVVAKTQAAYRAAFGFPEWRKACEVRLGWDPALNRVQMSYREQTAVSINGHGVLSVIAKHGPNVLLCTPSRTKCVLRPFH